MRQKLAMFYTINSIIAAIAELDMKSSQFTSIGTNHQKPQFSDKRLSNKNYPTLKNNISKYSAVELVIELFSHKPFY